MTKFIDACCLLNEIERKAPHVAEQIKELRGLMLVIPLDSLEPNAPQKSKVSLQLMLKAFAWFNLLPILVVSWGAAIGFVVTEQQFIGALLALFVSFIVAVVAYPIDKE